MIIYDVKADNPKAHLFNITMVIPHPDPMGQKISLPNWIPGSYLIRDFARLVITIEAFASNEILTKIAIDKIDSNTWQCEKITSPLTLQYTVYAWDTSVRGSHLDEYHAFFNPCNLLLQAIGQDQEKCKVNLFAPNCSGAKEWRVATTMTKEDGPKWSYGSYSANNYDELIDNPVEMGHFDAVTFTAGNVEHTVVVSGKHDGDLSRLANDLAKICQVHIQLFDNEPPFENYLFLLNVMKDGYGGLEHRSCTALLAQRDALPVAGDTNVNRNYINLLALFSHEYFHAWNVKRIKPACFSPYNLNQKSYTKQLWAFEGITSYYDELALVRSKVMTREQYFDLLAQTITKHLRTFGRKKQTLIESSFDAWTKFYQPNENSPNSTVSYYLKGSLVALAFDLMLRAKTDNQSSLDNLMQTLWREYGMKNIGLPEGKIEQLLGTLGQGKLDELIQKALYTTDELPFEELFRPFGLKFTLREAINSDDLGGKKQLPSTPMTSFKQGLFGWTLTKNQSRMTVSQVTEEGPAMIAGVAAQDELVAINGLRIDSDSYDKITKRLKAGQEVIVHIFRSDILKEKRVTLKAPALDTVEITVREDITQEQKRNLDLWLF